MIADENYYLMTSSSNLVNDGATDVDTIFDSINFEVPRVIYALN